jgi:phosphate/sulfate permease
VVKDKINKDEKKKPGMLSRAIMSSVLALIVVILFNIRGSRYGFGDLSEKLGWFSLMGWSVSIFWLAIFVGVFALCFTLLTIKKPEDKKDKKELTEEERKQKRKKAVTIVFLIISLIMTGLYVSYNYEQLLEWGLIKAVPAIAFFFGLIFMSLELFSFIKPSIFEKMVRLPWNLLIKVVIPMMPFVIILLGAIQAWYPSSYPFLDETTRSFRSAMFVLSDALQKVVVTLFNLGLNNPYLWFALTIGAFIVLIYLVVKDIFVEPEKDEDDVDAQEMINKAIEHEKDKLETIESWELKKKEKKLKWYEKVVAPLVIPGKEDREKMKQEELEQEELDKKAVKFNLDFNKR